MIIISPSRKVIRYVVEELTFLLKNLPFKSSRKYVIFLSIENVNFSFSRFALQPFEEIVLQMAWLLKLLQEFLSHPESSFFQRLILLFDFSLAEEWIIF